ncbi:MAG: DUF3303 family protein [Terriglobales bacterium]
MPVESGNVTMLDGSLPRAIEAILNDMKPEAAYFFANNGQRSAFVVFDMKDTSQIPAVAEPWFLAFNAHVEIIPAMNLEDLKKAAPGIERAVQAYGQKSKAKAA